MPQDSFKANCIVTRHPQTLLCLPTDIHKAFSHTCICHYSPEHFCTELLQLSVTSWWAGSQVYTLFSSRLHVSIYVTTGVRCPNFTLTTAVCREGRRVERENRLEHFSGVLSFFLSDQPEAVGQQVISVPKKKRRQQNTDKSLHSNLHQEKSHPQAMPATFVGPLILFCVFISHQSLLWDLNENLTAVFSTRVCDSSAKASFSNTMSSRQIWQVELRHQHIEINLR